MFYTHICAHLYAYMRQVTQENDSRLDDSVECLSYFCLDIR
jgi:hypothetical protein